MAQLEPIAKMVAQLSRLPGVGTKSAQRLAYHIISMPLEDVRELATAIYSGRKSIRYCSVCGNYSTDELCDIMRHHATFFAYPSANIGAAMWHVSFSPVLLFHIIHDTNSPPRHQDDIRATLDDTFFPMNFATFLRRSYCSPF